jgi:hypothetical protein
LTSENEKAGRRLFYLSSIGLLVTGLVVGTLLTFWGELFRSPINSGLTNLEYSRTLEELRMPEGQWLSGLPSYGGFEIPLPMDVVVKKADVKLHLTTDVSDKAVTSLRIVINGQRVYEKVLAAGRRELKLKFPIEYGLDQGNKIRVSMSLVGDVGGVICLDDEGVGAVVQVHPDSGVKVRLSESMFSMRDAMVMMPAKISIAIPTSPDNVDWMKLAAALGVHLSHLDYDVSYIPLGNIPRTLSRQHNEGLIVLGEIGTLVAHGFKVEGLLGEQVPKFITSHMDGHLILGITSAEADLVSQLISNPMLALASRRAVDPIQLHGLRSSVLGREVGLDSFGIDSTVQQVRFRRNWVVRYAIPDMPKGEVPEQLRVKIRLPEGPEDFLNLVHIELNDVLVGSKRLESPGDGELYFPLPRNLQRMRNRLQITLQRHRDIGGCEMPDARFPVQILPASALMMPRGTVTEVAGFVDLARIFSQGITVRIPREFSGGEAPNTLQVLLPVLSEFLPFAGVPRLVLVDENHSEIPSEPFLAYQYIPAGTEAVVYQPLQYSNGKRIIVDGHGSRLVQDVGLVDKAISVERVVSRQLVDEKNKIYRDVQGVLVTRSEHSPNVVRADFGWEDVLVLPDKEDVFEIYKDGSIPLREDMRRDNGYLYFLN